VSPLFFVTGTTGIKKTYKNDKGVDYRGVAAPEYYDVLSK